MRKLLCLIMLVGLLAMSGTAIAEDNKCDNKEQQAKLEAIIQELGQKIKTNPNDIQSMLQLRKTQKQLQDLLLEQAKCINNKNDEEKVLVRRWYKIGNRWYRGGFGSSFSIKKSKLEEFLQSQYEIECNELGWQKSCEKLHKSEPVKKVCSVCGEVIKWPYENVVQQEINSWDDGGCSTGLGGDQYEDWDDIDPSIR